MSCPLLARCRGRAGRVGRLGLQDCPSPAPGAVWGREVQVPEGRGREGKLSHARRPAGTPFPKNFLQVVKKILSRLFRVFVHVYIHHFDRIAQLGSEAHVNTCYKHFYYFVTEFGLIDTKELEPLVSVGRSGVGNRCAGSPITVAQRASCLQLPPISLWGCPSFPPCWQESKELLFFSFFFFLVLIEVNFTYGKTTDVKMNDSVVFSTFTGSCNPHLSPVPEPFITPKVVLSTSAVIPSSAPATTHPLSLWGDLLNWSVLTPPPPRNGRFQVPDSDPMGCDMEPACHTMLPKWL